MSIFFFVYTYVHWVWTVPDRWRKMNIQQRRRRRRKIMVIVIKKRFILLITVFCLLELINICSLKRTDETMMMMKHRNLAFHYWANVRVLIDDRQCRREWKGPNDSHTKTIHHIHTHIQEKERETRWRSSWNKLSLLLYIATYTYRHSIYLYFWQLGACGRKWHQCFYHIHIKRKLFVCGPCSPTFFLLTVRTPMVCMYV
jgi:hypothetical protein